MTEIFAYCLEYDPLFRNNFLKNLLKITYPNKNFTICTQSNQGDAGRPDIEILLDNDAIIIESKIEACERVNQLEDYKLALTELKTQKRKHLVFLTKYFEQKEIKSSTVKLHHIRWKIFLHTVN